MHHACGLDLIAFKVVLRVLQGEPAAVVSVGAVHDHGHLGIRASAAQVTGHHLHSSNNRGSADNINSTLLVHNKLSAWPSWSYPIMAAVVALAQCRKLSTGGSLPNRPMGRQAVGQQHQLFWLVTGGGQIHCNQPPSPSPLPPPPPLLPYAPSSPPSPMPRSSLPRPPTPLYPRPSP